MPVLNAAFIGGYGAHPRASRNRSEQMPRVECAVPAVGKQRRLRSYALHFWILCVSGHMRRSTIRHCPLR